MKCFVVPLLAFALAGPAGSATAFAQVTRRGPTLFALRDSPPIGARGPLSPEERAQLRQQLRSADRELYHNQRRRGRRAERGRPAREPHWRLSPAQREQLREDIMNANRRFRRR